MEKHNRNKKNTKLETKKKKNEILIFLKNLTNSKQAAFIGALSGIIALITTIIQTSQIFAPYLDNFSRKPVIPNSTSYTKLLVPLYVFPDGNGISQWNAIIEASKRVPITVIVNPDSGPGLCPNPVYSDSIQMLLDNDIETIGYVSTLEGRRDQRDVEFDIDTYLDCYNVNGIFIEAKYAATTENLSYYYSLYWYARHKNGMDRNPSPSVFLDTGNIPDDKFYKQ